MKRSIFFILVAALTVLCRASEAPSPTGVRLDRNTTLVVWDSESDDVTYTVQYRIREDEEWLNLPGCVKMQKKACEFSAIATDLYGATLRVRSQKNNTTSPWQQTGKKVGCVHTRSCSPEVVVMASPGYLSVQMDRDRNDQSLQDEYGAFLSYVVRLGRKGEDMQVFRYGCGSVVRVEPLHVGTWYCVEVRYLLYGKPHGSKSTPVCQLIPQSEWQRDVYLAGMLAGLFVVLVALSVACYCFITHHHQDIKDFIRPAPLPTLLTEFFQDEFVLPTVPSPRETHDQINFVIPQEEQEQELEEDREGSIRSEQDHVITPEEGEEGESWMGMGEHRDYEGSEFNSGTPLI